MNKNIKLLAILVFIILLVILVTILPKKDPEGPSSEDDSGFLADFLPFGKRKDPQTEAEKPSNISNFDADEGKEVRTLVLTKVSSMPIAGFGVFQKERYVDLPDVVPPASGTEPTESSDVPPSAPPTEFVPTLRYVEKTSGNVYQTFADVINERRFSETIVLGVHDAFFGDQGKSVIMRYLKIDGETIASFAGSMPNDALGSDYIKNEIKGSFLPENVTDLSVSPDSSKIFYISKAGNGVVGVTATPLGTEKTQIFSSPFTEWLTSWPNTDTITLTTKPSGEVPGFMYAINTDGSDFRKVLGGINGLTALVSPNGKWILYGNSTLALRLLNTETQQVIPLQKKTLPEKCVWAKSSESIYCFVPTFTDIYTYPDSWYQGEISFTDQIWRLDSSGVSTLIVDPETTERGERLDGIMPMLDENENYLFFINKKDSFLWELKLR
jgi:hypothetical protein